MHILQVASGSFFSTYGGGQVYVKNLVNEMMREGSTKVSVLSFIETETIQERDDHGCAIYETRELSDQELSALLKQMAPDIIHAHSHKAQLSRVGKSLNIPVIVTAHHGGIVCPAGALMNSKDEICHIPVSHHNCLRCVLRNTKTGQWWYPLMRHVPTPLYIYMGKVFGRLPFIYFVTPISEAALHIKKKQEEWKTIVNDSSLIIAPSEAIKNAMIRNGLPTDKAVVLPHGIPLPNEVPPFPTIEDGIRFFYVGRICYVKGIHILLESFHQLKDTKVQLHLIGGSGNKAERRYEKKLQEKYKNDHRIIWHGKIPPDMIYQNIKDYHISVAPSICLEIYGLNIAESLSMGKPVLATKSGGAEMQIIDGTNGWLVPPNDAKAITKKMEEAIGLGYNRLLSISNNCRAISIEHHYNALANIYNKQLYQL